MITSANNPLLKRFNALRDKKDRLEQGLFTIEGEKEILHASQNGILLETVLFNADLAKANRRLRSAGAALAFVEQSPKPRPVLVEVSLPAYQKIACRQKVEGVAAIARLPERHLGLLKLPENPLLLVLHDIEKPGNLGALLRSADGAGVDAVLVTGESGCDLYNPNVIRASLGAVFTLPAVATDLKTLGAWLKARAIRTVLTAPAARRDYHEVDLTGPVAIVLGSEDRGLPPEWLAEEACQVRLPMRGQMDSLNVSCAGAIMMYEAVRQRAVRVRS